MTALQISARAVRAIRHPRNPEGCLIYRLIIIVCLVAAAYFFVTG